MQAQWVAWVRARGIWILVGVGLLGAVAMVYFLPLILVPEADLDAERRLKAENDLRTTFVQAVGGAIVLVGTARTLHINREGQITERFTRAIDQLGQTGEEKLDVRLGGIYALERIARDSKADRGPIVEVLTAFLREHARWNPDNADTPAVIASDEGRTWNERPPRLRADFQAVATVLGRNRWSRRYGVDLPEVDLRGVNLSGAHLEEAYLSDAHLEGATLIDAHLEEAFLADAHLEDAILIKAHLEEAYLWNAHLEGATVTGAHLDGVKGLTPEQVERVIGLREAIGVPPGLLGT